MTLVSGLGVSCAPSEPPRYEKHRPEFLEIALMWRAGANPWFGDRRLDELRRALARGGMAPRAEMDTCVQLGTELLRIGNTDEAVATTARAFEVAKQAGLRPPAELHAWMGLAYLRQAEVKNCIARHNRDCCIFPLAGGGLHQVQGPARSAKQHYLAFLDRVPGNLTGRWLLNLAAMALGEYPGGVPERYRVPVPPSDYDIGRFVDVASDVGVDTFNLCGGAIAEDFDGDGLIDIVTSTSDPAGPLTYYKNRGDGGFEDLSAASRLDDQLGGLNCIGADYDGDGDVDVLVLRGAWMHADGHVRNSLLRNEGDGTFTDVTHEAGVAAPAYPTQTAAWADYDNDGDLDLYVGNESRPQDGVHCPGQLFVNDGAGRFTDRAKQAGVDNDLYCKGVAAGDYDNDGDMDLYVSNVGPNRLYRNNGDGTFTDVAEQAGVAEPRGRSFAVWFFDYDNDGRLDLFVAAYDASMADIVAEHTGVQHRALLPCLYRNLGGGRFEDVAVPMGLGHPWAPMGTNFGDLDNDGWLDIYITTGAPEYDALMPNVMLRNDGGKRFQNVTTSAGLGHLQKGHGVAFADFDHDGDQDIYNQLGGFLPGDKYRNALYMNPGHGNRWLSVRLVGSQSHRSGSGARVEVEVETPAGKRTIHRAPGSVSSFGGSPMRQEIGLGPATRIVQLRVRWPVSKTTQVFDDVPLDAMVRVREGSEELERVPLRRVKFR